MKGSLEIWKNSMKYERFAFIWYDYSQVEIRHSYLQYFHIFNIPMYHYSFTYYTMNSTDKLNQALIENNFFNSCKIRPSLCIYYSFQTLIVKLHWMYYYLLLLLLFADGRSWTFVWTKNDTTYGIEIIGDFRMEIKLYNTLFIYWIASMEY